MGVTDANRSGGSPHGRRADQEAGRAGIPRGPADIPKQGGVRSYAPATTYRLGPPRRPLIAFDNGHLDHFARRPPTASDLAAYAKWKAILEFGEGLRSDLTDALAAYRHFLTGRGAPFRFSYERYVMNDVSGATTLQSAILDIQYGVQEQWFLNGMPTTFQVTGGTIACGGTNPGFPYPSTENWQKAIGGHLIWLSAEGQAQGHDPFAARFYLTMTLHAEDRYNFNPGDSDIATGIPDEDNGIFEITGLAQQFDQTSTLVRFLCWTGLDLGVASAVRPNRSRHRQSTGNRRARNRI